MFDHLKTLYQLDTYRVSRRQTLGALVALPTSLVAALQRGPITHLLMERFLPSCAAAITSCWHLINDGDFATVHLTLASYLPLLETMVHQAEPYRVTAAHLASQAYLLAGQCAFHRGNLNERERCCQKAVEYAQESGDQVLFTVTQIHLAYILYVLRRSPEALRMYQKANAESLHLFPLLRSDVLIHLGAVYGHTNRRKEALRCLDEARTLFPEAPSDEIPVYLSGDFGPFVMLLYEGKTQLELGQHHPSDGYLQQAETVFAGVEKLTAVPERFRLEILNHRAETALHLGHLEAFVAYMEQGIQGARALGSQKRLDEVTTLYREVRKPTHSWHDENRVRDLADLLVS